MSVSGAVEDQGSASCTDAGVSVHEAVARVIGELPAIGKDSTGDGISYRYRGIEAIKAALKPLLAEHRVHYVLSAIEDLQCDTVPVGDRGKLWQRTRFTAHWLVYGPSGDHLHVMTLGVGVDSSDKAENKAVTTAEKQMLLTTFCVADSEDPDSQRAEIEQTTAAAPWSAKALKGSMVMEIGARVTGGDVDRATELAALAWDTFNLGGIAEFPAADAVDKLEGAIELAQQEMAEQPDDGGIPYPAAVTDTTPNEAPFTDELESAEAQPAAAPTAPGGPPPWRTDANMRADLRRYGVTTPEAYAKLHELADELGVTVPEGSLGMVRRDGDPALLRRFGTWVRSLPVT